MVQHATQHIMYSRANYKKWPWTSFLVIGIIVGSIFIVAGSPSEIKDHASVSALVLSIGFLLLGLACLIPSAFVLLTLIWYCLISALGCEIPPRCKCLYWFIAKNKKVTEELDFYQKAERKISIWTVDDQVKGIDDRSLTDNCYMDGDIDDNGSYIIAFNDIDDDSRAWGKKTYSDEPAVRKYQTCDLSNSFRTPKVVENDEEEMDKHSKSV